MLDNLDKENKEAGTIPNPQIFDDDFTIEKAKRYKEQYSWYKAEVDRLKALAKEVTKAAVDSNSLLELHKKDPKLANEVAKEFWYSDFNDAETNITGKIADKEEITTPAFTEDDFEKMYQKRKEKEEHEKAIKKASKLILKLDESLQEKAQSYFDKISNWKMLDEDTALEFAEMATLYVNKDNIKSNKYSDWLAMLWSTGINSSKKSGKEEWPQYVVRDWKLVLLSND